MSKNPGAKGRGEICSAYFIADDYHKSSLPEGIPVMVTGRAIVRTQVKAGIHLNLQGTLHG